MPRPQRGWKPVTITLSPEVAAALREAANHHGLYRGKYMGTIADQILRSRLFPSEDVMEVKLTRDELEQIFTNEVIREITCRWHGREREIAGAVAQYGEDVEDVLLEMNGWAHSRIPKWRQEALLTILSEEGYVPSILGYVVDHDFFRGERPTP